MSPQEASLSPQQDQLKITFPMFGGKTSPNYNTWKSKLQEETFPFKFSKAQTLMMKTWYGARNTQNNYFQPEKYFESQVGPQ